MTQLGLGLGLFFKIWVRLTSLQNLSSKAHEFNAFEWVCSDIKKKKTTIRPGQNIHSLNIHLQVGHEKLERPRSNREKEKYVIIVGRYVGRYLEGERVRCER